MFWLLNKLAAWLERPSDWRDALRQREALRLWAEEREKERQRKRERCRIFSHMVFFVLQYFFNFKWRISWVNHL